jgi:hypothetical protein
MGRDRGTRMRWRDVGGGARRLGGISLDLNLGAERVGEWNE